jgi:hypothetical protein
MREHYQDQALSLTTNDLAHKDTKTLYFSEPKPKRKGGPRQAFLSGESGREEGRVSHLSWQTRRHTRRKSGPTDAGRIDAWPPPAHGWATYRRSTRWPADSCRRANSSSSTQSPSTDWSVSASLQFNYAIWRVSRSQGCGFCPIHPL